MKNEFHRILRLRLDERNRQLIDSFTQAKQRMNARGLLNSTETIKEMYEILEKEFINSVTVIIDTAIDAMKKKKTLLRGSNKVPTWCIDELSNRKLEIEGIFLSNSQTIRGGLQNTSMIEPYISLDAASALQIEEMTVMLSQKMDSHLKESGGNLLRIIENRFFNIPVIVCGVIVITTIIAIANFTEALGKIKEFFIS